MIVRALRNIWRELGRLLPFGRAAAPRLTVIPKLAVPVGREAIAMADRPADIAALRGETMSRAGLCVMIVNSGVEPVTVVEIGLSGRFGHPRIVMRDPLLHDTKPWPRRLRAGETVVAYFASDIAGHHVLPAMRRAFASSLDQAGPMGRHGPAQARRFPGTCGRGCRGSAAALWRRPSPTR